MTPRKDGDLQEKINDSRLQKNPTCKNFREVLILGGYVQNAASVEVEKHTYIFVYRYRYISVYMERDIGYTYRYLLTYTSLHIYIYIYTSLYIFKQKLVHQDPGERSSEPTRD